MIIYLASSKTMGAPGNPGHINMSDPLFLSRANTIATELSGYSVAELQEILGVNHQLALLNKKRYMDFAVPGLESPAIMAYTGTAYKAFDAATLGSDGLDFAAKHMLIGSFMYGLLRPLDAIHPYRLEGRVALPVNGHDSMFDYWRPLLTDTFIDLVKADDGVLVNLASIEYTQILDWKKVMRELHVVSPQFKVRRGDKLATVIVYAKMCRGAMARWIIDNRPATVDHLVAFEYEGFRSEGNGLTFVLDS